MARTPHPSNAAVIKTAPLTAEVDRLIKARTTPQEWKEPAGFVDLIVAATGGEPNMAYTNELVRKAIVLAFIMGVNYDES